MLIINNVEKAYGSIKVADKLSFELSAGQSLGIIGPNGAGKTTLFNLITGTVCPDSGQVIFQGHDITGDSPDERCRKGIARSYQIPHPFSGMTVFENLLVGAVFGGGHSERESYEYCYRVLEQTRLLTKANVRAGTLTLLERKRLELARALVTEPKLLLLDEIAGGLTEPECDDLISTIKSINAQGISVIWIEHIVNALLEVVESLLVIDFGRKIAEGDPGSVMKNPEVQEIYMGINV